MPKDELKFEWDLNCSIDETKLLLLSSIETPAKLFHLLKYYKGSNFVGHVKERSFKIWVKRSSGKGSPNVTLHGKMSLAEGGTKVSAQIEFNPFIKFHINRFFVTLFAIIALVSIPTAIFGQMTENENLIILFPICGLSMIVVFQSVLRMVAVNDIKDLTEFIHKLFFKYNKATAADPKKRAAE